MQRFGRVVRLKPGAAAEYERLHVAVWPEVLATVAAAGIRNYTIFRYQEWLFSYFELADGVTLDEVAKVCKACAACGRWEQLMQTLQEPLPESGPSAWWVPMKEVFHL